LTHTKLIAMLRSPRGVCVHRLQLSRAESEPLEFAERLQLPAGVGDDDVVLEGEIEISGVVDKVERGFTLAARIRGVARLCCARCLKEFVFGFSESFAVALLPVSSAPQEDETQLGRDELDVRFFEAPEVDLVEVATEQLLLALPMKPLCGEACKGLCPRCGADLNQGRCACPAQGDERWVPLRGWSPAQ
jgi:uncharacterized protein